MSKKQSLDDAGLKPRIMDIGRFTDFIVIILIGLANFIPLIIFSIVWYKLNYSNYLIFIMILILIINIGFFFMIAGNLKIYKGGK